MEEMLVCQLCECEMIPEEMYSCQVCGYEVCWGCISEDMITCNDCKFMQDEQEED